MIAISLRPVKVCGESGAEVVIKIGRHRFCSDPMRIDAAEALVVEIGEAMRESANERMAEWITKKSVEFAKELGIVPQEVAGILSSVIRQQLPESIAEATMKVFKERMEAEG